MNRFGFHAESVSDISFLTRAITIPLDEEKQHTAFADLELEVRGKRSQTRYQKDLDDQSLFWCEKEYAATYFSGSAVHSAPWLNTDGVRLLLLLAWEWDKRPSNEYEALEKWDTQTKSRS